MYANWAILFRIFAVTSFVCFAFFSLSVVSQSTLCIIGFEIDDTCPPAVSLSGICLSF